MSNRVFQTAICKTNDSQFEVSIDKIIPEEYETKYKGNLFCPHEGCKARLKLVCRKMGMVKMLQSIDIHEHIHGCPYYFEYKKYDTDEKVNRVFSKEHIYKSINRHMKLFGLDSTHIYKKPSSKLRKPRNNKHEPNIPYYSCESIDEKLSGQAICVGGVVHSVKINDSVSEIIHAYINYKLNDSNRRISVLISNNRYRQENDTSEIVQHIEREWKRTPSEKSFVCVCFGRVQVVEKGINIIPTNMLSVQTGFKDKHP